MTDSVDKPLPNAPILSPEELTRWCDAETAWRIARQDAAALRREVAIQCEAARKRGYAEGMEQAKAEIAHHILATAHAAASALRVIEESLPTLVGDVVQEMLGQVDLSEVLPIAIRHGVARVRRGTEVTLRLSPDCAPLLKTMLAELHDGGSVLRVDVDPTLGPGRCVLESEFGTAELGLEAQMRVLRERLMAPLTVSGER
ncbi:type III secretion system stator protein SctL [Acetobacter sacchari]|uniref:Type 3 secretion system stator protein n=1 Tax=Acetobacter sacchari TaxID=2661687 RepID=A0ABS3LX06_9PROT|nr:type III secretion system stator protein SctL [Acetobacter sacchari]MBO1360442.1 type III secretion system stator protein SctL [Acetobacter sacchari]